MPYYICRNNKISKLLNSTKLNYNFNLNVSKFINKEYMAEWSKALHSGCSPKGREFESLCTHNYYFFILCII